MIRLDNGYLLSFFIKIKLNFLFLEKKEGNSISPCERSVMRSCAKGVEGMFCRIIKSVEFVVLLSEI